MLSHPIPSHPNPFWPNPIPLHSVLSQSIPRTLCISQFHLKPSYFTQSYSISFHHPSQSVPIHSICSIPIYIPTHAWSYPNSLLPTSPQSISNYPVSPIPPHHIPFHPLPSHLPPAPLPSPAWPKFFFNVYRAWPFFMSCETTWESQRTPEI